MSKKIYCPSCDKEIIPEIHSEARTFWHQNSLVEIVDKFYRCPECKDEWSVEGFDFAKEVYEQYARQNKE